MMTKISKKEIVQTNTDKSFLKFQLTFSDEVSEFTENIINTVCEPLLLVDADLRVVKASRSFYTFFKVIPNETFGTLSPRVARYAGTIF